MTISTFYPSLDGTVYHSENGLTWTQIVQAAGTTANYTAEYNQMIDIWAGTGWRLNARGILLFNTVAIPDDDQIISAKMRLWGLYILDNLLCEPDMAVYSANPASDTALVGSDYVNLGNVAYSVALPWASWVINDWNELIFIPAGLLAINKTGLTRLGVRNANYDVAEELDPGNHAPNWVSEKDTYFYPYMVEKGAPYRPELVVEHGPAPAGGQGGPSALLVAQGII